MNIQEIVNLKQVGVGTFFNSSTPDEVIKIILFLQQCIPKQVMLPLLKKQ